MPNHTKRPLCVPGPALLILPYASRQTEDGQHSDRQSSYASLDLKVPDGVEALLDRFIERRLIDVERLSQRGVELLEGPVGLAF
jgi:hypothetical protein